MYVSYNIIANYRGSHQRCCIEKGILENVAKFTGKYLYQSLIFDRFVDLRPVLLFKKRLAKVFSFEFCEIFKNTFFIEHL